MQQPIFHQMIQSTFESDSVDTKIDFLTTAASSAWSRTVGRVAALTLAAKTSKKTVPANLEALSLHQLVAQLKKPAWGANADFGYALAITMARRHSAGHGTAKPAPTFFKEQYGS